MSFIHFYADTLCRFNNNNKGMRLGQFFMNRLAEVDLNLYRSVPDSVDPFYDDDIFASFCEWLYEAM